MQHRKDVTEIEALEITRFAHNNATDSFNSLSIIYIIM